MAGYVLCHLVMTELAYGNTKYLGREAIFFRTVLLSEAPRPAATKSNGRGHTTRAEVSIDIVKRFTSQTTIFSVALRGEPLRSHPDLSQKARHLNAGPPAFESAPREPVGASSRPKLRQNGTQRRSAFVRLDRPIHIPVKAAHI